MVPITFGTYTIIFTQCNGGNCKNITPLIMVHYVGHTIELISTLKMWCTLFTNPKYWTSKVHIVGYMISFWLKIMCIWKPSTYSPPTQTGVGHQWTESTSFGCNQWLSLAKLALKVPLAGRSRSLVARTSKCGECIRKRWVSHKGMTCVTRVAQ